jgi:hypothetical protein
VFESPTDATTLVRLAPVLAAHHFRRPRTTELAPTVCGPARAILPTRDGPTLGFELEGPAIAGLDASELAAWAGVRVGFDTNRRIPSASVGADVLELAGAGVVLSLELPASASVRCRRLDTAPYRTATVYSLIVNARGDRTAVAVVVHDLMGHAVCEPGQPCAIAPLGGAATAGEPPR